MNKTYEELISLLQTYLSIEELVQVYKAYEYANKLHNDQKRLSGEPYIIHPINVAYSLALRHADVDTVCAALLHDVVEDTKATTEDIKKMFNLTVADLVDGVSKIKDSTSTLKEKMETYNFCKLMISLTKDIRVAFIKLADRTHNMSTLEYKDPIKQKQIALETLTVYVPLAEHLGDYRIKKELEDLSLKFLKPAEYNNICVQRNQIILASKNDMEEMAKNIKGCLKEEDIFLEIELKYKNIFGIYYNIMKKNIGIENIHDLLGLKILTEKINDCYIALRYVHEMYPIFAGSIKDYIGDPKTNGYKSLHTTIYGPHERLIQAQIRTKEMNFFASFGLSAFWLLNHQNAFELMQSEFQTQQFYTQLKEAIKLPQTDYDKFVRYDLLAENIYVYSDEGKNIELPVGANAIDLAYKISDYIGDYMTGVIINGQDKPIDSELHNNDRVQITTGTTLNSFAENMASTEDARRKIRERLSRKK